MGDIQQWRRKIQPARVKMPATTEPEDSDEPSFCPNTPKQRLKRKVSSYFDFTGHTAKAVFVQEEVPSSYLPQWPCEQLYPDPKAEEEIDSVMCALMSEPHKPLDARFNSSLMRIFECFFKLKGERDLLQTSLDHESVATRAAMSQYNMALKDWQDEKQDYKQEVKRLEVLLSKSSNCGLAKVTLARQDSKIRQRKAHKDDQKETVFEFLENTKRYDDRFYNSQRATMKALVRSPTDRDKRISQTLAGKKSMTNIHTDLPFGTPPDTESRFSLTRVSVLEEQARPQNRLRAITVSSTSDSTFSSFSCEAYQPRDDTSPTKTQDNEAIPLAMDDFSDIERLADALAKRRNIEPASVMPQLFDMFSAQPTELKNKSESMPGVSGNSKTQIKAAASTRVASESVVKRQTVMSKASVFFHRLIPQSGAEGPGSSRGVARRFSFEPGDDQAELSAADMPSSRDLVLRKSASLDALSQSKATGLVVDPLSSVAASPTASITPAEGRPPTRIPTPVYSSFSLAKPRQEREDSASSLLTAIRHAEDVGKRSNSLSSSVFSSPPADRIETSKMPQSNRNDHGSLSGTRVSNNNRLLDHKDMLRGSSLASAAARNAGVSREVGSDGCNCRQQGARSNHSSRVPDASEFQPENKRPV